MDFLAKFDVLQSMGVFFTFCALLDVIANSYDKYQSETWPWVDDAIYLIRVSLGFMFIFVVAPVAIQSVSKVYGFSVSPYNFICFLAMLFLIGHIIWRVFRSMQTLEPPTKYWGIIFFLPAATLWLLTGISFALKSELFGFQFSEYYTTTVVLAFFVALGQVVLLYFLVNPARLSHHSTK